MKLRILLALLACTFAGSASAKDKDKAADTGKRSVPITLAQCPAPVQATIQAYKPASTELEAEQQKGGPVTYDAKLVLPDGKRLKLLLAADGKLLESKEKKAK